MLQRIFPRQLWSNLSKLSSSNLSAAAAAVQTQIQMPQVSDRAQPFMDGSSPLRMDDIEYERLTKERKLRDPPIIEPKFFHEGQFVMEPEKYTIDCNKFKDEEIS
eukprot:CAMPEP_0201583452 /NCGR_PEP_ID=MMETSP0190_2-20130828/98683_1 /ASSEMBLY_ACC=CAM_ASM_000263 /TAXON_ID=37353 /ORGANISM="Rosalina sp." /LENGTH=104 /DNA_ID=CAMNT_0048025363 /DNA_START=143 /DNA_END=454 /DNA_ORIENTATION=+